MFLSRGSLWWVKFETGLFSEVDDFSSKDAKLCPYMYIKSEKKHG